MASWPPVGQTMGQFYSSTWTKTPSRAWTGERIKHAIRLYMCVKLKSFLFWNRLTGHAKPLTHTAFNQESDLLVSADLSGQVIVWKK